MQSKNDFWNGFGLAVAVIEHLQGRKHFSLMDSPDLRDCVRKVASGEISLSPSGVELRKEHPGLPNSEKIVAENNKTFRIGAGVIAERFQALGK
jgi:hypothetical protein